MVSYFCRENDFEDGNHFYRFLEHEPFIPKCFNFRGSINDSEPKPATLIGQRLTKIMTAILESYASDDRRHVDYTGISNSEEFRRYAQCSSGIYFIPSIKFHFVLQCSINYAAISLYCQFPISYMLGMLRKCFRFFFFFFKFEVCCYICTSPWGRPPQNHKPPKRRRRCFT